MEILDTEPHYVAVTEEIIANPNFYRAASIGAVEYFRRIPTNLLSLIVSPNRNTILHVNIASQDTKSSNISTKFVKQILERCPSLLLQVNNKGETPLHTAARFWDSSIVEVLIKFLEAQHEDPESGLKAAKQMLRMVDNEKNTALHVAALSNSTRVVEILTRKDPNYLYSVNEYGQTPLYIAAVLKNQIMVAAILNNCKSVAHDGPNGKTALHAAAIMSPEIITAILEKRPHLSKETDGYGWTPLHYAAYNGIFATTKALLEFDSYAAYVKDKNRKITPLLLAAGQGHTNIILLIVSNCPDCCEIVDDRGWNVLHFAMVALQLVTEVIRILKLPPVISLIKDKDVSGNTPLHLLAVLDNEWLKRKCLIEKLSKSSEAQSVINRRNLSATEVIDYGLPALKEELIQLSRRDDNGPYRRGVIRYQDEIDSALIELQEKMKESHLVVAALIATVTFTAAFTVPGGYKQEESANQGSTVLSKNSAFQAFVITDVIAMILSLSAVFIHYLMSLKMFWFLYDYEFWFTLVSMGAMVIAFITGTYAVLTPSLWLAIVNCFIGLSFFIIMIHVRTKMVWMGWNGVQHKLFCVLSRLNVASPNQTKLDEELNNLTPMRQHL